MFLKNFQVLRPKFEERQETLLDWIVAAHTKTETHKDEEAELAFSSACKESLFKLGLGENKIQKRGYHLKDCTHRNWSEMEIYNLEEKATGHHLGERMTFFEREATEIFEHFFPTADTLSSHLIHVTCTGYVAPSPAQKIVSKHVQGAGTIVTHAYHMGCYGSIPATRMAMGHYVLEGGETDIVHTEFCSLHMNPTLHSTEQLVIQSLFADGFIKYTLAGNEDSSSLKIHTILEEIVENSTTKMVWNCDYWGFQMTIAKEVPVLIRRHLPGYLKRLSEKAGGKDLRKARFAIHPGGPKIIEQIAEVLELDEKQFCHSREVLQNYGNMSSATLPHVWEKMLQDETVAPGELIVSLAFGPGLSISGALFEKR
jgi:predicted naringenin-chalcone synthase